MTGGSFLTPLRCTLTLWDVSTLLILLANGSTRGTLPHHPFKSRDARLGKRFSHAPVPHAHEVDRRRCHDMLEGGLHLPDIAGSSQTLGKVHTRFYAKSKGTHPEVMSPAPASPCARG